MRFLMLTTFYPPYHFGGDAVFVERLSRALAGRGHRVDVVCSYDAYRLGGGRLPPPERGVPEEVPGVFLHPLGAGSRLAPLAAHQLGSPALYRRRLRRLVEELEPDVTHFHNVSLLGGPGLLRLGRGVKLYTAHEYWLTCATHVLYRFGREPCTRRTCLRCTLHARRPPQLWRLGGHRERCLGELDRLLLPSRFAFARHREQGIGAPMEVLPHFVPAGGGGAEGPAEEAGATAGEGGGPPFFLFAGRLEALKGVEDLLPLFAGSSGAELWIAGAGSLAGTLRRRARELPRVRLLGALPADALAPLYRRAVAVLVPSRCYETFGMSAAEAMACGTPAIVRRRGALTELVEASGAGYACDHPDEWRRAIDSLLADRALRAELGERGRRTAAALWSEEAHLGRYLEIVEGCLERKRARKGGRGLEPR